MTSEATEGRVMENCNEEGARHAARLASTPVQLVGVEEGSVVPSSPAVEDVLNNALNRQVEAASKMGERIKELEEALHYSQKALKETMEAKFQDLEDSRSRRVLAEREACAKLLDEKAEQERSRMHAGMKIIKIERSAVRAVVFIEAAGMIRGRT